MHRFLFASLLLLFACNRARDRVCPQPLPAVACSCAACPPAEKTGSLKIELPKAVAAAPAEGDDSAWAGTVSHVAISIDAKENVSVDGTPVADDSALHAAVRKAWIEAQAKTPDVRAQIIADAAVRHGTVIHVLDVVKSEGISKIEFAVAVPAPIPVGK